MHSETYPNLRELSVCRLMSNIKHTSSQGLHTTKTYKVSLNQQNPHTCTAPNTKPDTEIAHVQVKIVFNMAALKTRQYHKDLLTLTGKRRNTACLLVAIRQLTHSLAEFKVTGRGLHAPVNVS
ncbi:hypothetical protein CBL_06253 [Carabus blaptoides fortunei]